MKNLLFLLLLLPLGTAYAIPSTSTNVTTQSIALPGGRYTLNFAVEWACDDYPRISAPGRIELVDGGGTVVARIVASVYRPDSISVTVSGPGYVDNTNAWIAIYCPNREPADGKLTGTWHIGGVAPGNYILRFYNYTSWESGMSATTVWTTTSSEGGSAPQPPTISWTSTPGTVGSGQSYTISAHGHDNDGNMTGVNIWKNGQPFAFAGGGNGWDGDSQNSTADAGPTTITFTAQAVDADGQTSSLISQTVTIGAANQTPTITWNTNPGTVASGQSYTVSAHGHDANGNLTQVNVWKSGQPFAFTGGGNGADNDSGNATSDTGPTSITFTAQSVDSVGAKSAMISQTVTVSAPQTNRAPTIAWNSSPGTVASGQSYTISAHGHDRDGNLAQVNVWKSGQPFAFAGGGNGTDGDSGNATSDTGPATITYTANAVDTQGVASGTISQTVTVGAPASVSASIGVSPTSAGSPGSTTVTWSSANATSVSVTGNGLNSSTANGTQSVSGLAAGSYTYTITAQGYNGPVTRTATFTVTAAPSVSATINASPSSSLAPGASAISWSSSNATSVSVSGTGLSSTAPSGSQTVSGLAAGTYTYTITAQGTNGPVSQTATVVVAPANSVAGSINASPSSGTAPATTTISWNTSNASSVSVVGNSLNSTAATGSQTVSGLAAGTYTYTLTAQGNGGPITRTATVTVGAAPNVSGTIAVSPTSATAPGSVVVSWNATNASSVSVSGPSLNSTAANGSQSISGLAAGTYTYALTAQGNGGPITRTATFTVNAGASVAGTISVSPSSMASGGTAAVNWSTANATSVTVTGFGITGTPYEHSPGMTVNVGGLAPGQTTWTLWADGPGGPITRTATIDVTTSGGPYGSLTANPTLIYSNQSSTLDWTTTGTSFRWVHGYSPGLNGVNVYPAPVAGSTTVSGLAPGNYRFTIEYGSGSSATSQSYADLTVLGVSRIVAVSITPAGAGTVSGSGNYAEGSSVTLTPTPDATHVFSGWSGDFSGSSNPLTFTVGAQDYNVTANFAPKGGPVAVKFRPAAHTILKDQLNANTSALVTERP